VSRNRAIVASHFLSIAEGYIATAVAERTAMQSLMIEEAKAETTAAYAEVVKLREAMRQIRDALGAEVPDAEKVSMAWAMVEKSLRGGK
jgi:hypothetical protein